MKRKLSMLLTPVLVSASIVACGSQGGATENADEAPAVETTQADATDAENESATEDHLARIKAAGKITIATEGVWSPFTYHDPETDERVGFDVEVATAIAKKLGVEPEFKEVAFDGGLTGVSTGTFDMMANGVDVTPDRSETYDFTDPYAYDHAVVVTLASNDSISSFEDFLKTHGYSRNGLYYNAENANNDTYVFFSHFGCATLLLSRLLNISPMILWHGLCMAPTSVTTIVTEEREKGIAQWRCIEYGDTSHLYASGMKPSFAARFCECFDNKNERHD